MGKITYNKGIKLAVEEAVNYLVLLEGTNEKEIYMKYPLSYLKELGQGLVKDKLNTAISKARESINRKMNMIMERNCINEAICLLAKVDNISEQEVLDKYPVQALSAIAKMVKDRSKVL